MTFLLKKADAYSRMSANNAGNTLLNFPLTLVETPSSLNTVKQFVYNNSATEQTNVGVYLDIPASSPETALYLHEATQRETSLTPVRYYGIGTLNAGVSSGGSALVVNFPATYSAANDVVQAGDLLIIQSPVSGGAHTTADFEFQEVDSVIWTGDQAAITLVGTLTNNWLINSTVSSVMKNASVNATLDNVVETGLTFDENSVVLNNFGTVEQTFTFTMTSATAFSVVGDTLGALASGVVGSSYAPLNPASGTAYLTIPPEAWTTVANGNSLVLQTHPSCVPVWGVVYVLDSETAGLQENVASIGVVNY